MIPLRCVVAAQFTTMIVRDRGDLRAGKIGQWLEFDRQHGLLPVTAAARPPVIQIPIGHHALDGFHAVVKLATLGTGELHGHVCGLAFRIGKDELELARPVYPSRCPDVDAVVSLPHVVQVGRDLHALGTEPPAVVVRHLRRTS